MGRLLRDTTLYTNLVGIAQGADSLMRMMSKRTGSSGKLLTDQTLYDQLNKLTDRPRRRARRTCGATRGGTPRA